MPPEAAPEAIQAALPAPRPLVVVAPEDGVDYENAVFANLYTQVNPSVVNVTSLSSLESLQDAAPHNFAPRGYDPDDLLQRGSGSGFVWDAFGHIVTNNHVIADADELHVTFSDGRVSVAELVGTDLDSDLAVLLIDPEGYDLVPIQRGSLDDIFVGMRVAAIGNPFGLEGTLTGGIISAMGRSIPARENYSIPDSIQTDAAINPGNSGGPLLNERGELIGVNAQIRSDERSNSGVGFAIPISIVNRVVPELIADGQYEHSYMGVSGQTYNPICADLLGLPKSARGSLVMEVLRGTPAARAGLRAGETRVDSPYPGICPSVAGSDLIVAVNGQPVTTFDDILKYLARYGEPGGELPLTVLRDGEEITVTLTLTERP